ncbi:hypothetical protein [Streptomyces antibioticus]|uniref:hypothetical protein n=1 Tax=Streptomyces antibioticus TaxID=1890 RepID=UPI00340729B3
MGIESDQVVYEYLSRVGDVAHQRHLSSATRMRLVSELRNEIDRRRAKAPVDSPAAVRRIIERLGDPDDVVAAAADGTDAAPRAPAPSVPAQRADGDGPKPKREQKQQREPGPETPLGKVPRPRPSTPPGEGGPRDWWQDTADPYDADDEVPGFVGGVIPDLLRPPPPPESDPEEQAAAGPVTEKAAEEETPPGRRRLLRALRRRKNAPAATDVGTGGGGWNNPLLLLAAVSLVAGAVLGNWFALLLGWLIAYASHRLTERETKFAVVWLPGLSVATGLVWLWGRSEGRWGDPIADGRMSDALAETWPWVVRGAAVATALFLLHRSRRRG